MSYLAEGQPTILNYEAQVVTYPLFTEYSGVLIESYRVSDNTIKVSATKRAFLAVQTGQYIFFDTGLQTSQVLKIIGINRNDFRIRVDGRISVAPTDKKVRIVAPIPYDDLTIRNNGVSNIYINGEALSPGERVEWDSMEGRPPVVIYGADRFQVANGRIPVDADSATVVRRFIPTSITPTVIMDARLTDDLTEENIEVDSNNQNLVAGVHYTLDLANNQLLAISPTTFPATGLFITIFR